MFLFFVLFASSNCIIFSFSVMFLDDADSIFLVLVIFIIFVIGGSDHIIRFISFIFFFLCWKVSPSISDALRVIVVQFVSFFLHFNLTVGSQMLMTLNKDFLRDLLMISSELVLLFELIY